MFIPFGTADGISTPQRIFPAQLASAVFLITKLEYRMSRARLLGVQSFG